MNRRELQAYMDLRQAADEARARAVDDARCIALRHQIAAARERTARNRRGTIGAAIAACAAALPFILKSL